MCGGDPALQQYEEKKKELVQALADYDKGQIIVLVEDLKELVENNTGFTEEQKYVVTGFEYCVLKMNKI